MSSETIKKSNQTRQYYDINNNFSGGCTHNNGKAGEDITSWWKLEFSTSVHISWIDIWNRMDSINLQYRIDKAEVNFLKYKFQCFNVYRERSR